MRDNSENHQCKKADSPQNQNKPERTCDVKIKF